MIHIGESNRIFRVAVDFDLSAFSTLRMRFRAPDDDVFFRSDQSTPGVTLGTGVTDPDLGVLNADEYVEYRILPTDFLKAGRWFVTVFYEDDTTDPDTRLMTDEIEFFVTGSPDIDEEAGP